MVEENALIFAAEPDNGFDQNTRYLIPWKIMIVDDEQAIHDVTRLALNGVTFSGRPLQFISCFSGDEARSAIVKHPDTALILLDVVMESETAGLDTARWIRDEIGNKMVRIVMRTGQPGQAPERKVITDFDINDYKEKTELTSSKLFTLLHASLRSYQYIQTIEQGRNGLAKVIDASADIFKLSSLDRFARGVLEQLGALLQVNSGAVYMQDRGNVVVNGIAATFQENKLHPIAGIGRYAAVTESNLNSVLAADQFALIERAISKGENLYENSTYITYFVDRFGSRNLLFIEGVEELPESENALVDLFLQNVSVAFENINLHTDLDETQREIIFLLGEAVETRSQETGNHVRRVALISRLLAASLGCGDKEADRIKLASPLHDLGKIGIPDSILNKPGALTPEEAEIMRSHAEIGYNMLRRSRKETLQAGAEIAYSHHEKWDGTGYPRQLHGEQIHLYGRITAVADVLDALLSDRCYKKAWQINDVLAYFDEQKGKHFDPQIVDVMLENLDGIMEIRAQLPD